MYQGIISAYHCEVDMFGMQVPIAIVFLNMHHGITSNSAYQCGVDVFDIFTKFQEKFQDIVFPNMHHGIILHIN